MEKKEKKNSKKKKVDKKEPERTKKEQQEEKTKKIVEIKNEKQKLAEQIQRLNNSNLSMRETMFLRRSVSTEDDSLESNQTSQGITNLEKGLHNSGISSEQQMSTADIYKPRKSGDEKYSTFSQTISPSYTQSFSQHPQTITNPNQLRSGQFAQTFSEQSRRQIGMIQNPELSQSGRTGNMQETYTPKYQIQSANQERPEEEQIQRENIQGRSQEMRKYNLSNEY